MREAYINIAPLKVFFEGDVIQPAFPQNGVPIVLSSSNYYAPFCGVTIQSILNHMSLELCYDIFIMTTGISRDQQDALLHMIQQYRNVSLRLVDMNGYIAQYQFFTYPHISAETYFRLIVPWVFEKYSKLIFLDSDMIICEDPAKLLEFDIGDNYIAASRDVVMSGFLHGRDEKGFAYVREFLGSEACNYFNAGIMVFNAEAMRNTFSAAKLVGDAAANMYRIMDQDVLNQYCVGKVYFLGQEWNMPPDCPVWSDRPGERKKDYISYAPQELQEEYRLAHAAPKVIHYTDVGKPWFFPDEDLADAFWETARKTPFYEPILFRLFDFQAEQRINQQFPIPATQTEYYPQGHLFKRTVKRIVRIFLPYGTKRRAVIKKIYFKFRGWPC